LALGNNVDSGLDDGRVFEVVDERPDFTEIKAAGRDGAAPDLAAEPDFKIASHERFPMGEKSDTYLILPPGRATGWQSGRLPRWAGRTSLGRPVSRCHGLFAHPDFGPPSSR
jgi:hypothetical protein